MSGKGKVKVRSTVVVKDNAHVETLQVGHTIINNPPPTQEEIDLADIKIKLRDTYQQPAFTKISLPFAQNPMHLGKDFVDLDVVERNSNQATSEPVKMSFADWIEVLERKTQDAHHEKQNLARRHILLFGAAGAGKSTFVKNMAFLWSRNESLDSYDWTFYLPLKKITGYSTHNLSEVIYTYWAQHFYIDKSTWDIAWKTIITQKVLILFNGYDEVSSQASRKNINRLLQEVNQFGTYLLSTRSYHLHDLPEISLKYELVGFNDQKIKIYIKNYLKDNAASLLDAFFTNKELQSIMRIPLNAALVCMIWQRWPQKNFNMTVLYQLMFDYLLCRYKREDAEGNITDPAEIRKLVEKVFDHLYSIALSSMNSGELIFMFDMTQLTSSDIQKILMMGLVKTTETSENTVELSQKKYNFVHLTFQEYLVAEYYANILKSRNPQQIKLVRAFVSTHKFDSRYSLILRFIAGIVKDDVFAINMYFNILLDEPHDLLIKQEIALIANCLEECQMSDLLVIKDKLIAYIKTTLKNDPDIIVYSKILEKHPLVVNHTNITGHLIESLESAKNSKERNIVYEMMIANAVLLNASDFAKIFMTIIEIAKDTTISLRSHDACKAIMDMHDKIKYNAKRTQYFYEKVFKNIGEDNFVQYFLHFKKVLADVSNPKLLRLGAITVMHAMLSLIKILTWENFVFFYNIIQNENEDQEIIEIATLLLDYAFNSYDVRILDDKVNALIENLLETILKNKAPEDDETNRTVHGTILGNIVFILKYDETIYYNKILDFIWDKNKSKSSRTHAARALLGFVDECVNIDQSTFSHDVIDHFKSTGDTDEDSLEIALEFFLYADLVDRKNIDEELDFFLLLLKKQNCQEKALQCLGNIIDFLDENHIDKLLFHVGLLIAATDDSLIYLDLLHELVVNNLSQESISKVTFMIIQMFNENFSPGKNSYSLKLLQSICNVFDIISKKSIVDVNLNILKYIEKTLRADCRMPYLNEIFYTGMLLKVDLYPDKFKEQMQELVRFLHNHYEDADPKLYSIFHRFTADQLLTFYTFFTNNLFERKAVITGIVHKFYKEKVTLYFDNNYYLNFQENNEYKKFKFSYSVARQFSADVEEYMEERFGWVVFANDNLSPASKFLLYLGAPALLAFGAKVVSNPTATCSTAFSRFNLL